MGRGTRKTAGAVIVYQFASGGPSPLGRCVPLRPPCAETDPAGDLVRGQLRSYEMAAGIDLRRPPKMPHSPRQEAVRSFRAASIISLPAQEFPRKGGKVCRQPATSTWKPEPWKRRASRKRTLTMPPETCSGERGTVAITSVAGALTLVKRPCAKS